MNFSKMDRRLTILNYAPTAGSMGGVAEAWIEGDTVWAEQRVQPGREVLASGQVNAPQAAIFFLRWRSDIGAKDRVRCEGIEYDVSSTREIGRRDGLEIVGTARR
jgi:SPP1 family predicted phage head-tail adaptor